jgi:hypothetical protein
VLLVTLALKTLLSISQNGISPITLNKHLSNQLNKDILNASIVLDIYGYKLPAFLTVLRFALLFSGWPTLLSRLIDANTAGKDKVTTIEQRVWHSSN